MTIILILIIIYFIFSKTFLKSTIDNYNNKTIENASILQNKIYPIIETTYNIPIEIKFNKLIKKITNYKTKPPIKYSLYEYSVYYLNSIDIIRVEWEIIENDMIIKSISKYNGKENKNIYTRE
jgi:hypothetical protein